MVKIIYIGSRECFTNFIGESNRRHWVKNVPQEVSDEFANHYVNGKEFVKYKENNKNYKKETTKMLYDDN